MLEKFKSWCQSGTAGAKCTRTIAQGVLGVIIVYLPDLVAGSTVIPAEFKAMAVAAIMAVLSPIQATIGGGADAGAEDVE